MDAFFWIEEYPAAVDPVDELSLLAAAARAGVPVPPAFIIPASVSSAFIASPAVRRPVLRALRGLSLKTPELFAGAAADIRKSILAADLPAPAQRRFDSAVSALRAALMLPERVPAALSLRAAGLPPRVLLACGGREAAEGYRELLALSFSPSALHARFVHDEPVMPAPYAVLVMAVPEGALHGSACTADAGDGTTHVVTAHGGANGSATVGSLHRLHAKSHALLTKEGRSAYAVSAAGEHLRTGSELGPEMAERLSRILGALTKAVDGEHVSADWSAGPSGLAVTRVAVPEPPADKLQAAAGALLSGAPGNPGTASGPARIIRTASDWSSLRAGEIAVAETAVEPHRQALAQAAALITVTGHAGSSEAALAASIGIPAVLAVPSALQSLQNGQTVTVDGALGAVYAGRLSAREVPHPASVVRQVTVTATKVLACIDDPEAATSSSLAGTDGIGVLRSEFVLNRLGLHPREVLRPERAADYRALLLDGVRRVMQAAAPRTVAYQLHDLTEEHVFTLGATGRGSHRLEPNPLLGYRGAQRTLSEPELLELELEVIGTLLSEGYAGLEVVLPLSRTFNEIETLALRIRAAGPSRPPVWARCATPALLIRAEELAGLPVDGIVFDAPMLATLTLGVDHTNARVAHSRDQADPAVREALAYAVSRVRAAGLRTMVLAEEEPLRPELLEAAVRAGVTAFCVPPEEADWVRRCAGSAEQRLIIDRLLEK